MNSHAFVAKLAKVTDVFPLVSFRRRPEQMGTNMASPYKALKIKVNYFS